MSDETKLTDDQLRLATSRSLPPDAALDAETSAARDSFMALGSAIESAARHFDQAALLCELTTSPEPTCSRFSNTQYAWPLIASGALAAGMLLAVARLTMEHRQTNEPTSMVQSPVSGAPRGAAGVTAAAVAWNDPLDDEITLAAATIDRFSHATRGFDGSLLDMNDQLQALSRELQGETL